MPFTFRYKDYKRKEKEKKKMQLFFLTAHNFELQGFY